MTKLNYAFVHYWVREVTDSVLQRELDFVGKMINASSAKKIFTILLSEKLRRAEEEIAII